VILLLFGYLTIHQLEYEIHKGESIEVPVPPRITRLIPREKGLKRFVFGYYPYWNGDWYTRFRYDLLNHIAYFCVDLHPDGSLGEIPNPSILKSLTDLAHRNGVGVSITAVNFSQSEIDRFLASAQARSRAIHNLKTMVETLALDGVNIDLEFPSASVRDYLVTFMKDLTDTIHALSPLNIVTIATPAVDWWGSFDYHRLSSVTDGLFIMAYDYYWSGSSHAGPVAPLRSSSLWGPYSDSWTVNDYLNKGADPNRLLLGVPYYGYRWPTETGGLKARTTGSGVARIYATLADSAEKYGKRWEDRSKTVWYRKYTNQWYQAWFDDSLSLSLKYQLVIDSLLFGAGIWALGYDRSRTELWGAIETAFGRNRRDARFVDFAIPDTMAVGETALIWIKVENTGNLIWPDSGSTNPYRIGAGSIGNGNPHDNQFPWFDFQYGGYSNHLLDQRAYLGDSVFPDSTHTLTFKIEAPRIEGRYWFEARMVCDGVGWFGPPLSHQIVVVRVAVAEGKGGSKRREGPIYYDILGRKVTRIVRSGIYFEKKGKLRKIVVIR